MNTFQSRLNIVVLSAAMMVAIFVPASIASATGQTTNSPQSSSVTLQPAPNSTSSAPDPLTCGWEVAESAYNQVSGVSGNDGVTDLNYDTCTRDVYGSLGSYLLPCQPGVAYCGTAELFVTSGATSPCSLPSGGTGCNTGQKSDAGYTAYVSSTIDAGAGDANATTGSF